MVKQTHWAIPVAADVTALLAWFLLSSKLTLSFASPSGLNAFWLMVGALWYFFSTLVVRKQETSFNRFPFGPKIRLVIAVLFAIGLTLAISHQLGYLDTMLAVDPRELGSGESAVFFVLAPGAWLAFSLLYVIFLGFNVKENAQSQPWLLVLALLGINGMALLAVAELSTILNFLGTDGVTKYLLGLGLLIPLIGPPRFIYQFKQVYAWPLFTFLLFLLFSAFSL